ncbi:MAG: phenylalanine--tRNA ligase subunit beta [Candidatus Izemoplasmatales bacterium]
MRVSLNWLRELVDVPLEGTSLVKRFNLMSAEIESHEKLSTATGLVVGAVLTCADHPDSDHLHVTTVDIGGEVLQIVCGAKNVAAGQKVVVALEGAVLPGDFRIRRSKIRGVESNGMICSLDELGIDHKYHQEDGIHVLPDVAVPGTDPLKVLCFDDEVIELDLTPNRGDLLSMMGVAHDVAAMEDGRTVFAPPRIREDVEPNPVRVTVESPACRSYYARVIRGVKVGESPLWMKARLIAAGVRPISNVVDITNYVMLETGQPLHAFDLDKVGTNAIVVRTAGDAAVLRTLDGKERPLLPDDLVITDGIRPIALAGVMGGLDTEVDGETKDILLESAVFDGFRIRKTSKRLDLRSESSIRFERGLDPARTRLACDRAAELFAVLADGRVLSGVSFVETQSLVPSTVDLPLRKLASVTGRTYEAAEVADVWNRLGFAYDFKDGVFAVHVPTRRPDVRTDQDLIEEVVRISGYHLIPTSLHKAAFNGHLTEAQKRRRLIRNTLAALGLDEVVTYSLVAPATATAFDAGPRPVVRLLHPMSEERSTLRHSLVPSLLEVLEYNLKRKAENVRLFELGKGYALSGETELIAGALTGNCEESAWQGKNEPFDFFAVKGILEALFTALSVKDVLFVKPTIAPAALHPGVSAEIDAAENRIGVVGKLHPNLAAARDLPDVFVFELDLAALAAAAKPDLLMREIAKFPAVRRDVAVVVDRAVPASAILSSLRKAGGKTLSDATVFDVYEGDKVEDGKKSVALALSFQDYEKTLETAAIDALVQRLVKALANDVGAVLRS